MKACCGCKLTKRPEDFPPNKKTPDGLQPFCKDCNRERVRKWREDHPDLVSKPRKSPARQSHIVLSRHELSLVIGALEVLHDAEYMRPERQEEIEPLLERLEKHRDRVREAS